MEKRLCTVFGATGFVGREIVTRLAAEKWHVRAVARRLAASPDQAASPFVEPVVADLCDTSAVSALLQGASVAVNAVSLYHPTRKAGFDDIHVAAARGLAMVARERGLRTLIHLSGIGADADSRSSYVSARGRGELAVREAFPKAILLRPSAIFSPNDTFLNSLMTILRRAPLFPLFGNGDTRLQPVYLGDVAAAVARLADSQGKGTTYELGGPDVLSYRALLELLCRHLGRRPLFLPVPFWLWGLMAQATSFLNRPPLTEGMVALMRRDNIVGPEMAGFPELGLKPRSIKDVLPEYPNRQDL